MNHEQASENVNPLLKPEALKLAQQKTIQVLNVIQSRLKTGMTEDEARRLALEVFQEFGVTKHWHRPYIRFGYATQFTFNEPIQNEITLTPGAPYYLDLGPIWPKLLDNLDVEGDYGDTFIWDHLTAQIRHENYFKKLAKRGEIKN